MDHEPITPSRRFPLAGAVVGAIALAVLPIAFGAGWMMRGVERVEVARAPTAAELDLACTPKLDEKQDELTTAQTRVADLERDVATRTAEVNELQARIARNAEGGKALRAELERMKTELAATKEQLAIAEAEKERLLVELTETKEELADTQVALAETKVERDEAREDALFNRFNQFLADSQLEICEKGNRKKLGNCREVVHATLSTPDRRDAFAHCVRSGQATPMVRELDKGQTLPEFSSMLDEEQKQTKGWYVEMCDPTLPERTDIRLADGQLPPTAPPQEG
ncbi:MAG: hypothetical protein H6738_12045 [Alphaproteobacteria bacterium]|nr:hypothetical protein [Alphaproteobacteria bacterium]MCB9697504.1 hypothetical protein [Alphaproteobacteria bacterium]